MKKLYIKLVLEMKKYTYDEKFSSNMLVVGWTGCGKTTFVRKLALNKMFGKLKQVDWILKIELSKDKEKNISLILKIPM